MDEIQKLKRIINLLKDKNYQELIKLEFDDDEISTDDLSKWYRIGKKQAANELKSLGYVCYIVKINGRSARIYKRLGQV